MDDQEIIARFFARDEEGLTAARARYEPYCAAVARNLLTDPRDQEECLSDTWLRAWNAIPPTRPTAFQTWLGRIARNLALDRYDYNHAAKRSGPFDQLLSELSECIPCQRDDFAQLELTQILNSFLHSLPESRRNLFLRRYWYCESVEELGRRYRMSQSAVKSSLFRTRNKLKAYLEKEGVGIE